MCIRDRFPASLLTGALATFGLEGSKKRSEKDTKVAENAGMVQTIRVETPIKKKRKKNRLNDF